MKCILSLVLLFCLVHVRPDPTVSSSVSDSSAATPTAKVATTPVDGCPKDKIESKNKDYKRCCYQCNSAADKEEECATDVTKNKSWAKPCALHKEFSYRTWHVNYPDGSRNPTPKLSKPEKNETFQGCRTLVQDVGGEERIQRSCAYHKGDKEGDKNGIVKNCNKASDCSRKDYVCEEGFLCNSVDRIGATALLLTGACLLTAWSNTV